MSVVTTRALVLAGGGLVGIAWELGVLLGLRAAGIGTRGWDRIVGTSAGSVVGAAAGTEGGLDALRQAPWVDSATELNEYLATLDPVAIAAIEGLWFARPEGPDIATRAAIGKRAINAGNDQEARFIRTVAGLLPLDKWPAPLVTTAVDAETGAFLTFDAGSGVSLVAAVAASCSIPGVFPPVTINGRRYIDGGVRSGTCADLADGYDLVVLVALTQPGGPWSVRQAAEVAELRGGGSRVVEITPGPEPLAPSEHALLEPSLLPDVVESGMAIGAASAAIVRDAEAA
jgi:NTE family protein